MRVRELITCVAALITCVAALTLVRNMQPSETSPAAEAAPSLKCLQLRTQSDSSNRQRELLGRVPGMSRRIAELQRAHAHELMADGLPTPFSRSGTSSARLQRQRALRLALLRHRCRRLQLALALVDLC